MPRLKTTSDPIVPVDHKAHFPWQLSGEARSSPATTLRNCLTPRRHRVVLSPASQLRTQPVTLWYHGCWFAVKPGLKPCPSLSR
jgi:hypothetical protein